MSNIFKPSILCSFIFRVSPLGQYHGSSISVNLGFIQPLFLNIVEPSGKKSSFRLSPMHIMFLSENVSVFSHLSCTTLIYFSTTPDLLIEY